MLGLYTRSGGTVERHVILVKPVQPLKAQVSIFMTDFEITTLVNPMQPAKRNSLMDVTDSAFLTLGDARDFE